MATEEKKDKTIASDFPEMFTIERVSNGYVIEFNPKENPDKTKVTMVVKADPNADELARCLVHRFHPSKLPLDKKVTFRIDRIYSDTYTPKEDDTDDELILAKQCYSDFVVHSFDEKFKALPVLQIKDSQTLEIYGLPAQILAGRNKDKTTLLRKSGTPYLVFSDDRMGREQLNSCLKDKDGKIQPTSIKVTTIDEILKYYKQHSGAATSQTE